MSTVRCVRQQENREGTQRSSTSRPEVCPCKPRTNILLNTAFWRLTVPRNPSVVSSVHNKIKGSVEGVLKNRRNPCSNQQAPV